MSEKVMVGKISPPLVRVSRTTTPSRLRYPNTPRNRYQGEDNQHIRLPEEDRIGYHHPFLPTSHSPVDDLQPQTPDHPKAISNRLPGKTFWRLHPEAHAGPMSTGRKRDPRI